ncbi:biotin/lipoate--protein ligase family protein [Thalassovita sp.]|uniref:biotin/lipoate--protein ligase family protein n=1 Tax=Thalassovita sp. TaxID=1979401 RepID=UPI0029DE82BA|nr:DUF4444 domain-containing protein [Thalassovita sp.]
MWGETAVGDAIEHACMRATMGCDAGLVTFNLLGNDMQGAIVFAPEVPLRKAMTMLPLCGVGFQNALGAIAPPEVAVHLDWDGGIRINGASCGRFHAIAADNNPDRVPDWLVIGLRLPLHQGAENPGDAPDQTTLYAEGCADVSPADLLEAWARHTLNWITRWEDGGTRALHNDWRGLAHGIGEDATRDGITGTFLGVDEDFGMLLRVDQATHLIPLTSVLEDTP